MTLDSSNSNSSNYVQIVSIPTTTNSIPAAHTSGTFPTSYGYNCGNCGTWVNAGCGHNCYYFNQPYYQPYNQQVTIFPIAMPFPIAVPVETDIQRLDDRISAIEAKVEKLLDLLLNEQDEEVRGHPEGELSGVEVSVEVRGRGSTFEAPQPKGATSWPSRKSSE